MIDGRIGTRNLMLMMILLMIVMIMMMIEMIVMMSRRWSVSENMVPIFNNGSRTLLVKIRSSAVIRLYLKATRLFTMEQ